MKHSYRCSSAKPKPLVSFVRSLRSKKKSPPRRRRPRRPPIRLLSLPLKRPLLKYRLRRLPPLLKPPQRLSYKHQRLKRQLLSLRLLPHQLLL